MRLRSVILAVLAVPMAPVVAAEAFALPSGQIAQPLPVIWDEDASAIRLRYVLSTLTPTDSSYIDSPEGAFADMHWLCDAQLAEMQAQADDPRDEGWTAAVVTLMDRDVPFGTVDRASFQLFEWFSLTAEGCEQDWDAYHD